MNGAIEDSLVEGYDHLIPTISLPDENDRHVLAAAVMAQASVIVTFNLRDFPAAKLAEYHIKAQHPDAFIRHVLDLGPLALEAVKDCRRRLKNPPYATADYIAVLARQGLPNTVAFLDAWLDVI
jgi:hypothetical protein